jgi:hypothetical protein
LVQSEKSKKKKSETLSDFYSTKEKRILQAQKGRIGAKAAYDKFLEEHPDGRKVQWITKLCKCGCGKQFELQPHLAKIRQFASRQCKWNSQKGKEPWNKGLSTKRTEA